MPRRRPSDPRVCLLFLLSLALLGVRVAGADEALPPVGEGQPLVQYFTAREFHAAGECLAVAQDARGVVYVGNRSVVLEYDGSTWRQVSTGEAVEDVVGMAYDAATDTVFASPSSGPGYLRTEPGGAHTFVSLADQLPPGDRNVGGCPYVFATPEGVYFVGTDRVLCWHGGRFQVWRLATDGTLYGFRAAGRIYVSSRSLGLLRLENGAFVPVSTDPVFHESGVRAVLPGPDGTLLVAFSKRGFCTLGADGAVRPVATGCDPFFKQEGISTVIRLRDGSLAVGTANAGLVLLDREMRFRSRIDKTGGLHADYVYTLFEDAEGGLWVGQFAGLARVEVDSPLSLLRAEPDADLSRAIAKGRWGGALALGSDDGIHRVAPADPAAALSVRLERLAGGVTASESLSTVANGLLLNNAGKGVLLDNARQLSPVLPGVDLRDLRSSRAHPGRVYYATDGGHLGTLRLDAAAGHWIDDARVAELGVTGRFYLLEGPGGDLWVGTRQHGVFRVAFDAAGAATVTPFFDRPGLLHGVGNVSMCIGGGWTVFATDQSLFRWDEGTGTVVPLTEFGPRLAGTGLGVGDANFFDARTLWITFGGAHDPTGGHFRGRVLAAGPGRAAVFQPLPHEVEEAVGEITCFHLTEESPAALRSVLVVGSASNAVLRLDVPRWEAGLGKARPFATLIRRAFTTRGEGAAGAAPILGKALEYARNTAHFEYAANTFVLGAAPKFQTRLGGFGAGGWSDWSERTSADYLNLPEGGYTFEVRARNSDGQMGGVASMPFRVLPPWQRSPWAYALYALAAAGGVYALVRWRGRQLRRRNVELEAVVETRTGELRGREAELVRARDDAEGANRAKSAFLANMSHELRTPLNAVLGHSQLLLKQTNLSPDSRERVTIIGQSGGHLLSLVNEVLDLSKVEAGKLSLSPFDFSLDGLLGEVVAVFRPRFAEKGLAFTETRAPGLPATVHTDPSRLRQVLYNLLSNAVKFTHQGSVTLTVRPGERGRVRFEVADTGVGIAPEDQRDIFMAFYQTGESSLAAQGTGLGLTISQRLVELLGGRIEVASKPGVGSRFWFELPLAEVAPAGGSSPRGVADAVLGHVKGYEGATRRLLLVDDLAENRRVLRDFLQPLGFEIEEEADGAGCLAACARAMPDGVLLDLRLGAMDGFEVARTLRARQDGGKRPGIIAISASVFESNRQQAIDAGCDDFLPKPFEEAQLLATLGRVLSLRWLQEVPPDAPGLAAADAPSWGEANLPASEIELLRELCLRGDAVGIRHRLDAWHADGTAARAGEIVRRIEALVAVYDLEAIHALLPTVHPHGSN